MPKAPVPAKIAEVLAHSNPAVICSVRPDGRPISVATWYVWDNGRILVNLNASRKRMEYTHVGAPVSLTVLKDGDWYSHVSIQGSIASVEEDPDMADIDRIARHYTGKPFYHRDERRISVWIDVERWHAWGAAAPDLDA